MERIEEISHGDGAIVESASYGNAVGWVLCDQAVEGGQQLLVRVSAGRFRVVPKIPRHGVASALLRCRSMLGHC